MTMRELLLVMLIAGVSGCGDDDSSARPREDAGPPVVDDAGPSEDGSAPGVSGFRADRAPTGAAIIATAELDGDRLDLRVIGHDLGRVLGFAYDVRWDATALDLDDSSQSDVLRGAGGSAADTRMMAVPSEAPGGMTLGATRVDPTMGDADLRGDAEIAHLAFRLRAGATGTSRIDIERTEVRRADASFVPVAHAGGELSVVAEVAR